MNAEKIVQERLRTVFDDESIIFERNRFIGGLTNYNYIMDIHGREYVIRQPGIMTEEIIDRRIERVNNAIAAELGINSNCIYFDEESGMKISEYIPSQNVALADPCGERNLTEVARLIKMLHFSKKVFPNIFDWRIELKKYENVVASLHGVLPFDYSMLRDKLFEFVERNITNPVCLPCHNDTVPENFLLDKTGHYYLIDWEYSGMNDPAWDIAAYIVESRLTKDAIKLFIESYYGMGVSKEDLIKIKCYIMAQDLLWSTWALIRHYGGEDFLDYYTIRYSRFTRNLHALLINPEYTIPDMVKA